jgi:hypothetical protein
MSTVVEALNPTSLNATPTTPTKIKAMTVTNKSIRIMKALKPCGKYIPFRSMSVHSIKAYKHPITSTLRVFIAAFSGLNQQHEA